MSNRRFWLMKSEPDEFSIDDLINSENQTTIWSGVRNYQARNFMRDEMSVGDGILFYHSNAKPLAVVGTMFVSSEPYPDPTQFDPQSDYFDPKSIEKNPRWFLVNVTFCQKFDPPVLRESLQKLQEFEGLMLLQKGSRLSIQPVSSEHWTGIHKLARAQDKKCA
jgi:predicted RNA-binding protein with PUA-like domain